MSARRKTRDEGYRFTHFLTRTTMWLAAITDVAVTVAVTRHQKAPNGEPFGAFLLVI
jgi:hypothetical protein